MGFIRRRALTAITGAARFPIGFMRGKGELRATMISPGIIIGAVPRERGRDTARDDDDESSARRNVRQSIDAARLSINRVKNNRST